jgi:hypothetical protein
MRGEFRVHNGKLEDLLPNDSWEAVQQSLEKARTNSFRHFLRWLKHLWVTKYVSKQSKWESSETVLRVKGATMLEGYKSPCECCGPELQDQPSIFAKKPTVVSPHELAIISGRFKNKIK